MSPRMPRSSASALSTSRRTTGRGGSNGVIAGPAPRRPAARRTPGAAPPRETKRPSNASEGSGKSRRVCDPRDSVALARRRDDRARHAQQVDDLVARDARGPGGRRRAAARSPSVSAASSQAVGVAHDAAVGRHHALHRAAHVGGIGRAFLRQHDGIGLGRDGRRAGRAHRSSRRSTPRSPCPARIASTTRRPNTRPSSSEFDASRFAPCTPLHAASPHAQRCGERRGAVEIGDDAAREVVRGRRDRQPVLGRVEARRAGTRTRSSGSGARSRRSSWRRATRGRRPVACMRS